MSMSILILHIYHLTSVETGTRLAVVFMIHMICRMVPGIRSRVVHYSHTASRVGVAYSSVQRHHRNVMWSPGPPLPICQCNSSSMDTAPASSSTLHAPGRIGPRASSSLLPAPRLPADFISSFISTRARSHSTSRRASLHPFSASALARAKRNWNAGFTVRWGWGSGSGRHDHDRAPPNLACPRAWV